MKKTCLLIILCMLLGRSFDFAEQHTNHKNQSKYSESSMLDRGFDFHHYERNEGKVYNFSPTDEIPYYWFLYIPPKVHPSNKMYLYRTDYENIDLSEDPKIIFDKMLDTHSVGRELNLIEIGVLFYSKYSNETRENYFVREFYGQDVDEQFRYPHQNIEQIIDQATATLNDLGITVENKVLMSGFSELGIFPQRFSILSPKYVDAYVGGQIGGLLTLPTTNINGQDLPFPLGISDYQKLTGKFFDADAYSKIKQFVYIGSRDTNAPVLYDTCYGNPHYIKFIAETFGISDPEKVYKQSILINELGNNMHFKMINQKSWTRKCHENNWPLEINVLKRYIEGLPINDFDTPQETINEFLKHPQQLLPETSWMIHQQKELLEFGISNQDQTRMPYATIAYTNTYGILDVEDIIHVNKLHSTAVIIENVSPYDYVTLYKKSNGKIIHLTDLIKGQTFIDAIDNVGNVQYGILNDFDTEDHYIELSN